MGKLHEVELHHLRPTQITVGMIEVHDKRRLLEGMKQHERRDFLADRPIPAVWGPGDKLYITDHHHLACAATEASIDTGFFLVEADFSKCAESQFWIRMQENHWVHPIDESGTLRGFDAIPSHLKKLVDDPYRSLAAYVRNAGGFIKTTIPFAEFLWADFFRSRVKIGPSRADFDAAVKAGLKLANSEAARLLPGFQATATPAAS